MDSTAFIVDSPTASEKKWIMHLIKKGKAVYVIEPFHAYHHQFEIPFFPKPLPGYIKKLIESGLVKKIDAESLSSKDIYFLSTEKSVAVAGKVFPFYHTGLEKPISILSEEAGSTEIDAVYRRLLCEHLAFFFSINITMERIEAVLGKCRKTYYFHIDVDRYERLEKLMALAGEKFFQRKDEISFSSRSRWRSRLAVLKKWTTLNAQLLAQFIVSSLFDLKKFHVLKDAPKKRYSYAISITAPQRQFRKNLRGPQFLIDDLKVKTSDVLFLSLVPLRGDQLQKLKKTGGSVMEFPRPGRLFANGRAWKRLLFCALKGGLSDHDEVNAAAAALFALESWKKIFGVVEINNFITHADFSRMSIARNILFKKYNVRSWYYTDAFNFGLNFRNNDTCWFRHPFWAYLHYDHLLTWSNDLKTYFQMHPESFDHISVVGCIWAGHIPRQHSNRGILSELFKEIDEKNAFVISAFTSTYTVNGSTSYHEGIQFLKDLKALVDDFPGLYLVIKEKKNRDLHIRLEPAKGKEMVSLLDNMDRHRRVCVLPHDSDASTIIGASNLCVSFPFTSISFEAKSAGFPAIWHDPLQYYRNTPFSAKSKIVTHGYAELRDMVMQVKAAGGRTVEIETSYCSQMMDPFGDGKAIDRFREIIGNNGRVDNRPSKSVGDCRS